MGKIQDMLGGVPDLGKAVVEGISRAVLKARPEAKLRCRLIVEADLPGPVDPTADVEFTALAKLGVGGVEMDVTSWRVNKLTALPPSDEDG